MQYLYWEERWVQSHAVLQLQTRFLLDVPRQLEDSRVRVLWMLKVRIIKALGETMFTLSNVFRYKENPNIANESVHAQAREALKKYLHYFERVSEKINLNWQYSSNDFNISVGESLKKFETRGCDFGKNQKPHHGEGDGRIWDLDRLAISVWLRQAAGQVPIYPAVHISIRLLHGNISQETVGKKMMRPVIVHRALVRK